jgi:hypothetical protein
VRRTILWNAILLALSTGVHAVHASDTADPRAVWEQAIQAKGGRERLRKVQTLAIFMKPAQVVLAGPPTNWLCVFPDRYFEWEGRKGVESSVIVNGTAGQTAVDAMGRPRATRNLTSIERDRLTLNQVLYLLETAWLQPEPLAVRPARLHKDNVLTIRAGGRTFDLFLNSSNLPERIFSRRGGDSRTKYDFHMEHYREFQGISLPTRVTGTEGNFAWTWDVDYEIDAKYNPKLFERPPDLNDGPEPWRRR